MLLASRGAGSSVRFGASATAAFQAKAGRKILLKTKIFLEVLANIRPEGLSYGTLRGTLSPNRSLVAEANSRCFNLLSIRCRTSDERFG
jgi:hypothetical protein